MAHIARPWESILIVRASIRVFFTKDNDNENIEEIVIKNIGVEGVSDFPLPINNYRHGVVLTDGENNLLSLKSRDQIVEDLETVNENDRSRLQFQLENEYLLWIVLPRPIQPLQTQVIQIKYYYTSDGSAKSLAFSFPRYVIQGRAGSYPLSIYITCPSGLELNVNKVETCAYRDEDIGTYQNRFDVSARNLLSYKPELNNLITYSESPNIPRPTMDRVSLFTKKNIISFVIPSGLPRLSYLLSFNLEIPKNHQIGWKVGIGVSVFTLSVIVVSLLFYSWVFNAFGSEKHNINCVG